MHDASLSVAMIERLSKQLPQHFGEAVRAAREDLGISQEELAGRCGLHRTYLAGVERGIRNPSLKSIGKVAQGLHLTLSALFRRMEAMRKPTSPVSAVKEAR
jgi:transcriptional regulator with XRE-family HTH domain